MPYRNLKLKEKQYVGGYTDKAVMKFKDSQEIVDQIECRRLIGKGEDYIIIK